MLRKSRKILAGVLGAALFSLALAGCGKGGTKVVLTAGFSKNEVFRIEDVSCTLSEIRVYLTNVQNQYEAVYGKEIWSAKDAGPALEQSAKDQVLAEVAQIKAMTLLAEEKEVSLDETEEGKVAQAAEQYFSSLSDYEKEVLDVEQKTIENMYHDYALAEKVYRQIIEGINPEISDDEARTITVDSIFLKTYVTDSSGEKTPVSDAEREEIRNEAEDIRQMAADGEDFQVLADKYSDDTQVTYSFRKGEKEAAIEEAAFNLAKDEVSQVIETEDGFYIMKCLNTFDREETDANKVKMVEERKNEAFNEEYDTFVGTLVRNLNEELWNSVTLIHDEQVTTSSFFEVYDSVFEENA